MYHASLITIPEHDISMAVLSSGGSSIYNQMFASKVLLEVLEDQGVIEEIKEDQTFTPPVKVKMPTELNAYSGLYGTVGTTLDIQVKTTKSHCQPCRAESFQSRSMSTLERGNSQVRMEV